MRWFILFLLLAPLALADSEQSGWYYPGDTWEEDGVIYTVEGTNEQTVLLGVGGTLILLALYECRELGSAEYCYVDTAYPDDEDHIKYQAGNRYYGYFLTITTYEPEVKLSRTLSDTSPDLREDIEVSVTFDNTGDYNVNKIVYDEPIPEGMKIITGPVKDGSIHYEFNVLRFGNKEKFTYRLQAHRFGEFDLVPFATYEYNGKRYNVSIGEETIDVDTPVTVKHAATPDLAIDEWGLYQLNITNVDDQETLKLAISVPLPKGLPKSDLKGFIEKSGNNLTKELTLGPDDEAKLSFKFLAPTASSLTIPLYVTISGDGYSVVQTYEDKIAIKNDMLEPTIRITPKRDAYYPGTELTISGVLLNKNSKVQFNTIQGTLESDLFSDVTFRHESFPAAKELTEASTIIYLPTVTEARSYPVTFSGTYNTPSNKIMEFSADLNIKVVPTTTSVKVSKDIKPQPVAANSNITVSVRIANTLGQYITFDAHEKYPSGLIKTEGLTFAEKSLDRDKDDLLYLYSLEIPANFTQRRFNLTTVVKVKGQDLAEEYVTEVELSGIPEVDDEVLVEETSEDDQVTDDSAEGEEKVGFFTAIWNFLKGLIS